MSNNFNSIQKLLKGVRLSIFYSIVYKMLENGCSKKKFNV